VQKTTLKSKKQSSVSKAILNLSTYSYKNYFEKWQVEPATSFFFIV
jgi:hypothetical protein